MEFRADQLHDVLVGPVRVERCLQQQAEQVPARCLSSGLLGGFVNLSTTRIGPEFARSACTARRLNFPGSSKACSVRIARGRRPSRTARRSSCLPDWSCYGGTVTSTPALSVARGEHGGEVRGAERAPGWCRRLELDECAHGCLQVACNGTAFRSCSGGVVCDHPRGLPVAGEHHVGGRCAPTPARPVPIPRLSTPAASAAAVNRSPTICANNGTTRSPGSGLVAARSVRRARATPSFTNRTSFTSPSWFVLLRRDGDEDPIPVGRIGHVGPA